MAKPLSRVATEVTERFRLLTPAERRRWLLLTAAGVTGNC
jgi:hypothetical protein